MPAKLEEVWNSAAQALEGEEREQLRKLLINYQDVFADSEYDLGNFKEVYHEIDTGDAASIKLGLRRTHRALQSCRQNGIS